VGPWQPVDHASCAHAMPQPRPNTAVGSNMQACIASDTSTVVACVFGAASTSPANIECILQHSQAAASRTGS
jgi:hypothetical protein